MSWFKCIIKDIEHVATCLAMRSSIEHVLKTQILHFAQRRCMAAIIKSAQIGMNQGYQISLYVLHDEIIMKKDMSKNARL